MDHERGGCVWTQKQKRVGVRIHERDRVQAGGQHQDLYQVQEGARVDEQESRHVLCIFDQ